MEVFDKYLVYKPATPEVQKTTAKTGEPLALTPGVWQNEMTDTLKLYDAKAAAFSSVTEPPKETKTPEAPPTMEKPVKLAETSIPGTSEPIPQDQAIQYMNDRQGSLLGQGMVLKADQFPTIHKEELQTASNPQPEIEGAPNFRQIKGQPLYGVAQPTVEGIKNVLKEVGAAPDSNPPKTAVWTNLREEPCVYINGVPFNPRQNKKIFRNLERTGISAKDVEAADKQLKQELLAEAAKNGGKIMITDETKDGKIVHRWMDVTQESVKTVDEVYSDLKKEGYKVDYARIPITDEKRPENKDFDALVNHLKDKDPNAPMIFNCHAGRGRTTTGLVVAGLMRRATVEGKAGDKISKNRAVHEDIRETGDYTRAEYKKIFGILNIFNKKPKDRKGVDEIIDNSSAMTNLKDSIKEQKDKASQIIDPTKREEADAKMKDYLERYNSLVAFDAYLTEQADKGYKVSFSDWLKDHKEYKEMQKNIELAMGMTHGRNIPGSLSGGAALA